MTKNYLLLLLLALSVFSCKDDAEDPEPTCTTDPSITILENLVGTWNNDGESVTFNADGTGSASDSFSSFAQTNDGIDYLNFTYGLSSEPDWDIEATWDFDPMAMISQLTVRYKVIKNLCDEIELEDGFGNTVTLTK